MVFQLDRESTHGLMKTSIWADSRTGKNTERELSIGLMETSK